MHEYFRLSISMGHLPLRLKPTCRRAIETVRKLSFKEYPELENIFSKIKAWLESKRFHTDHFNEIRKLFKIIEFDIPVKYLTLNAKGYLETVRV